MRGRVGVGVGGCGWVDERGYGQLSKRAGLGDGRWVAVGAQFRTLKGPFSMPTGFTGVGKGVCQVRAERSCRCFCSAAAAASPSAVSSATRTDETVYLPPPPPAYLTVFFEKPRTGGTGRSPRKPQFSCHVAATWTSVSNRCFQSCSFCTTFRSPMLSAVGVVPGSSGGETDSGLRSLAGEEFKANEYSCAYASRDPVQLSCGHDTLLPGSVESGEDGGGAVHAQTGSHKLALLVTHPPAEGEGEAGRLHFQFGLGPELGRGVGL